MYNQNIISNKFDLNWSTSFSYSNCDFNFSTFHFHSLKKVCFNEQNWLNQYKNTKFWYKRSWSKVVSTRRSMVLILPLQEGFPDKVYKKDVSTFGLRHFGIAHTYIFRLINSAKTLSIMTLNIMALSIMTLSIMTLSIMTLSITILSKPTLSMMTPSITTFI